MIQIDIKTIHWPDTEKEIIYIFDQRVVFWILSMNTKYLGKNQYIVSNFTKVTDIFV